MLPSTRWRTSGSSRRRRHPTAPTCAKDQRDGRGTDRGRRGGSLRGRGVPRSTRAGRLRPDAVLTDISNLGETGWSWSHHRGRAAWARTARSGVAPPAWLRLVARRGVDPPRGRAEPCRRRAPGPHCPPPIAPLVPRRRPGLAGVMARPTTTLRLADIQPEDPRPQDHRGGGPPRQPPRHPAQSRPDRARRRPHGDSGVGLRGRPCPVRTRGGWARQHRRGLRRGVGPCCWLAAGTGDPALPLVLTRWLAGQVDADDLGPDSLRTAWRWS